MTNHNTDTTSAPDPDRSWPVEHVGIPTPAWVELEGDVLCWDYASPPPGMLPAFFVPQTRPPRGSLLPAFFELAHPSAKPEAFLAFARRWGALELCGHDRVFTHDADCLATRREPLTVWKQIAARFRGLRRIMMSIERHEPVALADLDAVGLNELFLPPESAQTAVRGITNRELRDAGVRPSVADRGSPGRLGVVMHGGGLYGALAFDLAMTVGHTRGWYRCSACDAPYTAKRKPRDDEAHYCGRCRDLKEPERLAAERLRERKKENPAAYATPRKPGRTPRRSSATS